LELQNQVSILTERIINLEEEMTKLNPDFHRKDKGIFQEIAELMEKRKVQMIYDSISKYGSAPTVKYVDRKKIVYNINK
jgi:hypothetical protein